ncbi:hypothetical protein DIPPA_31414 [Diplonema papillatum]|nr:hypothetical protein DIPPA_31414 [Diplonema papillatum]
MLSLPESRPPPWRDARELQYPMLEEKHQEHMVHLKWPLEELGMVCRCSNGGAIVVHVDGGGPAERARIAVGSRVVSVYGRAIYADTDLLGARRIAAERQITMIPVITAAPAPSPLQPRSATAGVQGTVVGGLTRAQQVSFKVSEAVAIRPFPQPSAGPRYPANYTF